MKGPNSYMGMMAHSFKISGFIVDECHPNVEKIAFLSWLQRITRHCDKTSAYFVCVFFPFAQTVVGVVKGCTRTVEAMRWCVGDAGGEKGRRQFNAWCYYHIFIVECEAALYEGHGVTK